MRYRAKLDAFPKRGGMCYLPFNGIEGICGWFIPSEYCNLIEVVGEMALMEFEEGSRIMIDEGYLKKYFKKVGR